MKCIIFANGYYGDLERYREIVQNADMIICADGGANYACKLGIIPSVVIGDMDSINQETRNFLSSCGVKFKKYPVHKDFTDLQLTLEVAEEAGADLIILLGTLGHRLDHTIGNLFSGMEMALKGKRVVHYGADCIIYLITSELLLKGNKGDTVSVITMTDKAVGVTELGMEYPLNDAVLESSKPHAVSNVMEEEHARITVREGVLAVFHYR
jgi:thiamine pyrophosphokinase